MPFGRKPKEFPEHLWTKCPTCGEMLFNKQLLRNLNVCSKCEHHFRLGARSRIELLVDKGSFVEQDAALVSGDPLGFVDSKPYPDRIAAAQVKSGEKDAAIAGSASIGGNPVELVVMDFEFMGGSMGIAVGEAMVAAARRAVEHQASLIVVPASGGARMQEGILSLMQMPRTILAADMVKEARLPYIVILTDPTTGGVTASFAMLGDITVAEPGAIIGFAGARVIEDTVREKLPAGFGKSEFLLEKGFLDQIVSRAQLKERVAFFLGAFRAASQDVRWGL